MDRFSRLDTNERISEQEDVREIMQNVAETKKENIDEIKRHGK